MSYTLAFLPVAWEDYQHWHQTDKGIFRRINALLKDMQRTPFAGIGKPELLRYARAGTWSRRITQEHRLGYEVDANNVFAVSCRYHYEK